MQTLPTGAQYPISSATISAVITEQGGTLRRLDHDGRPVLSTFGDLDLPQGSQNQHMLPWANRIADGRYQYQGRSYQASINEVDRGTALHGTTRWLPFELLEHTADTVRQRLLLMPDEGYPGLVEVLLTQSVSAAGYRCEVTATNQGLRTAPLSYCAHPYLDLGGTIDDWVVDSPMTMALRTDDRLLPVAFEPVAGTPMDFTSGSALGAVQLDHAMTTPGIGAWELTVRHQDRSVTLWADEQLPVVQFYTPDDRRTLAVEPCSAASDSFNPGPTHQYLVDLAPGQSWTARWGLQLG